MGYPCSFTAISARIPREDLWTQPEGGPERARTVASQFFGPGWAYAAAETSDQTYPSDDGLWVATFGDTVIFSAATETLWEHPWDLPPGFARWDLNIHSVVDLCQFEVTGGPYDGRRVELHNSMGTSYAEASHGPMLPSAQGKKGWLRRVFGG